VGYGGTGIKPRMGRKRERPIKKIQEARFVEKNRKNSVGEEANATTLMGD